MSKNYSLRPCVWYSCIWTDFRRFLSLTITWRNNSFCVLTRIKWYKFRVPTNWLYKILMLDTSILMWMALNKHMQKTQKWKIAIFMVKFYFENLSSLSPFSTPYLVHLDFETSEHLAMKDVNCVSWGQDCQMTGSSQ